MKDISQARIEYILRRKAYEDGIQQGRAEMALKMLPFVLIIGVLGIMAFTI